MASSRQPLIPPWLWPGLLAGGVLISVALLTLTVLWQQGKDNNWPGIWHDRYLWQIIRFTFWQALLSTLLSVLPAILLARALWRRRFPGRQLMLRLCAMTLVLPVLVALFGILRIYGRQGVLAELFHWLNIDYTFSPYGLQGILLAHVFFNLPLASRLLLQALENITVEQRQLAVQLGMNPWQQFRFIEWPYLRRQIFPVGALIFMLCFASFATVLTLGGPRAATIELAIYQALSWEYDLNRAALLALVQLSCCVVLLLLSQCLNPVLPSGHGWQAAWCRQTDSVWQRVGDSLVVTAALLLLLPPLLAVIISGSNQALLSSLAQPLLWQAVLTSAAIALAAALLCVLLTMMLLWSSRELKLRHRHGLGQLLEMSGMLPLAMPGIVLATALFLLLHRLNLSPSPYVLIILLNAMMAVPYALKILDNPMKDVAERYTALCLSLNMRGWYRWYWVEWRALQRPLAQALAFAAVLSVGDFGIAALLGDGDFYTLPLYLYRQTAAYRTHEAAVTALLLLLLCFLLFTLIERLPGHHADT